MYICAISIKSINCLHFKIDFKETVLNPNANNTNNICQS